MNKHLLEPEVQKFISDNLNIDITSLILKAPVFSAVTNSELAQQIQSKLKSSKKLPTWFSTPQIYFPNKLNVEQTSSELAAKYKSELIKGESIIDLSGGLGVDSFYFSKTFKQVIHCELDKDLSEIANHNFNCLGMSNIENYAGDGISYLESIGETVDWIYIDPARRHDIKGKVYHLSDCQPNVLDHLELLFSKSNNILIKTSPMLDISKAIEELQNIKEIHIVSLKNEVKELLFMIDRNYEDEPLTKCIELVMDDVGSFSFYMEDEKNTTSSIGAIQSFLYEPSAGILKSGGFKIIGDHFKVNKLHRHTHLYSSNEKISFPGRIFKILETIPFNNKQAKKALTRRQANISSRNFPLTTAQIRKRYKIKDGGSTYIFFTTDMNDQRVILICEKA